VRRRSSRHPRPTRGSDTQQDVSEPQFLAVAHILRPHGVRGELRAEILTEDPTRFGLLKRVYVGREGQTPVPLRLERYRLRLDHGWVLLKFEGYDDRDRADELRGAWVQIPESEGLPLDQDEYYEHQIIGLTVETSSGEGLGRVTEILYTGANDVYVVRSGDQELLIPVVEHVVLEVDLPGGRLVVDVPDGLR
jgi:16S rRNA processing protein RimM